MAKKAQDDKKWSNMVKKGQKVPKGPKTAKNSQIKCKMAKKIKNGSKRAKNGQQKCKKWPETTKNGQKSAKNGQTYLSHC